MIETLVSLSAIVQGAIALLSLLTVAVTVVLVIRQTSEMSKQSVYSAYATAGSIYKDVACEMMAIDRLFFEHPEMRPYFYEGAELPDDPHEAAQVESLAELFMDFLDMVIVLETTTPPQLAIPWHEYQDYFRDIYCTSPVIRRFYADNRTWYDEKVRDLLDPLLNDPAACTESGAA